MSARKRQSLGKGLKALIPVESKTKTAAGPDKATGIFECRVSDLVPNDEQPRQSFDEKKLAELTESVLSQGVIQPLVVRALGDGHFQIVAGERRWRAARLAKLERVPVVVKDLSDTQVLEVALIENLQREDLNPLEEAEAYQQLIEEHGLTQEKLAQRVGKQRSTVANALRLLKLPEDIQTFLLTGELTMGHARALLGLSTQTAQKAMARKVVREKMSVRQCEDLVRKGAPASKAGGKSGPRSQAYSAAQYRVVEGLQRRLGTKVDLRAGRKGGKVVIHYFDPQELERILDVIEGR